MQTLSLILALAFSATTAFAAPAASSSAASSASPSLAAAAVPVGAPGSGVQAVTPGDGAHALASKPTSVGPDVAARADSQLPDPTRPPASILAPVVATGDEAPHSAGLQSILLPKPRSGSKPRAIIHGQTVEIGGRVGEARLVHLTETTAVLQGPEGREVLHLVPQDMVKPVRQPVSKPRAPQRKSRAVAPAAAPAQ